MKNNIVTEWIWSSQFLLRLISSSDKGLKNSGLKRDSNPDLCNAGAVLHQLSYQVNWEQVFMLKQW